MVLGLIGLEVFFPDLSLGLLLSSCVGSETRINTQDIR